MAQRNRTAGPYLSYDANGLGYLQHETGRGAAVGLPPLYRVADVVVEVGFQLQLASAKLGEVHIRFKASQRSSCSDALHIHMYNIITVARTSQVGACNNPTNLYKQPPATCACVHATNLFGEVCADTIAFRFTLSVIYQAVGRLVFCIHLLCHANTAWAW